MTMPRVLSERSYDDITYKAGGIRNDASGSFSPFTFLCISLILTLLGLVILYSASYTKAIGLGYPHYYYFARQAATAAVSVILGALLAVLPVRMVSKAYCIFLPLSLIFLAVSLVPGFSFGGMLVIKGYPIIQPASFALIAIVFTIAELLPYTDEERSARNVIAAALSLIVLDVLILFSGGLSWFVLSSLLMLMMLRRSRVPRSALILSLLFMVVTGFGFSFIYPELLSPVFSSILPVADETLYNEALAVSLQAIIDGGIAGTGIGSGLYKLGELTSPESEFIFAVFSEELGIVGTVFLLILFILYLVIGVRTSKRGIEKEDYPAAALSYGLSLMIVLKALCNMLYVSGVLPFTGVLLPFFSYSIQEEAITMLSSVMLYRLAYKMGREHES